MMAPMTMITEPIMIDHRRPHLCATYGAMGIPKMDPSW